MTKYAPIPRAEAAAGHLSLTLDVADPSSDVLIRHVRLLRDCVALAQQRWGFGIEAAVVLPARLELLCAFPDRDFGPFGAARLIKPAFQRHLPSGYDNVWADEAEMLAVAIPVVQLRRAFIENAPVRMGLAKTAEDWPYSSAHRGVAQARALGNDVA